MTPGERLLDRPVRVLFTSAGNEALHGFVDDLRRRAPRWVLLGTDLRPDAAGLYRCDAAWTVPARSSPDYLPVLSALCAREQVDVVFPLSTADQDYFAQSTVQQALWPRPVVVSSPEALAIANHKVALFQALADWPELLPEFAVVHGPEEAIGALASLVERHGAALLKTDAGTGSRDMIFVGDPGEDPAPSVGRIWIPLSSLEAALVQTEEAPWPRLAVAYLPGEELCADLLLDQGEMLGGAARLRYTAFGSYATHAETVSAPDVLAAAARIGARLGLRYVNHFQFRRDAQGQPRLLECNPRIPISMALTVEAGLNLPLAAVMLALGVRLPLPAPELGVQMLRHIGQVFTRRLAEPATR